MSERQEIQLLLEQQRSSYWKAATCCIIACLATAASIVWAASRDHTQLENLIASHQELRADVTARLRSLEITVATMGKRTADNL